MASRRLTTRIELLKLSKKELIKKCKKNNITISKSKNDMADRLLKKLNEKEYRKWARKELIKEIKLREQLKKKHDKDCIKYWLSLVVISF